MPQIFLPVLGMTCAACVSRVERRLSKINGVAQAQVNLATERASITFDAPARVDDLVQGIEAAGFSVPEAQQDFRISGMTCASCVGRVERGIAKVDGVTRVAVNLATETATVTTHGLPVTEAVVAAVAKVGFDATPIVDAVTDTRAAEKADEARLLRRDLILAALLTVPLVVIEMGGHILPTMHHFFAAPVWRILSWALATAVLFGPGLRFWRKGLAAMRALSPDMNTLVMTGAGAAWAFSSVTVFAPNVLPDGAQAIYFESTAIIITLVLLGRWFEARAKAHTSDAIRSLMALTPPEAIRIINNTEETVPVSDIRVGDMIRLRAGDRVPVDGVVISGGSHVDEAMLTGEAAPVSKTQGDNLTGGTVNGQGLLLMRATRVGADTVLSQILRMVQAAQGGKLPIQAVVDQITRWFVPVVMVIAAITFALWFVLGTEPALPTALVHAVAVLIIACPCAMGLATPVSIMVGTGRAAEIGVLFRNGAALQSLAGVKTIAFDKTGTLTMGRPAVVARHISDGFDDRQVLRLAAAAETGAQHPLADALRSAAGENVLEVQGFNAVTGKGVSAIVDDKAVRVGSAGFMIDAGIDISGFTQAREELDAAGQTPIYVSINDSAAALYGIADEIRPDARRMVESLRALGVDVAMISGDSQAVADRIGAEIGISHIVADVMPAGKVRALQALAGPLAFVGDGINDAPALAAADVGIAIGAGTAVAVDSADVVLSGDRLVTVAQAVGLARATLRNIHQNLFWAFAYNAALIPVAAGVLAPRFGISLSPVLAAAAMALSSVFVLSNALRLRFWRNA